MSARCTKHKRCGERSAPAVLLLCAPHLSTRAAAWLEPKWAGTLPRGSEALLGGGGRGSLRVQPSQAPPASSCHQGHALAAACRAPCSCTPQPRFNLAAFLAAARLAAAFLASAFLAAARLAAAVFLAAACRLAAALLAAACLAAAFLLAARLAAATLAACFAAAFFAAARLAAARLAAAHLAAARLAAALLSARLRLTRTCLPGGLGTGACDWGAVLMYAGPPLLPGGRKEVQDLAFMVAALSTTSCPSAVA
jgi:hypothetical protein